MTAIPCVHGKAVAGMDEHDTRHVPVDRDEVMWARCRPPEHRTPRPQPGDPVLYRHQEWDRDVHQARLLEYTGLDDYTDPLVWRPVVDTSLLFAVPAQDPETGKRLVEPVDDPWPLVVLDTKFGRIVTREARIRGSAGWLPPDWRTRFRPLPSQLLIARFAQPVEPQRLPLASLPPMPARPFVP